MKNIITTILITLLTYSLYAQVPGIGQVPLGMKYQAVARGADGEPMSEQAVALRFNILQGSENGTVIFTEPRITNTNAHGLFVLTIGSENQDDFQNIDWRNGDHFLNVELNDGNDWIDLGTHQLLSVPYAMTAGNGKLANPEFNDEILRIHGSNGSNNVVLGGNGANSTLNNGTILVTDENSQWKVALQANHNSNAGDFQLKGQNNNNNIVIGPVDANYPDFGVLRILDDEGTQRITAFSAPGRNGAGLINVRGENGNFNVGIGNQGNNDHGAVRIFDAAGLNKGEIISAPSRAGAAFIRAHGANGNLNVQLSPTGNDNHGQVCVYNENNVARACMLINANGLGEIFADIKNFRMDHPKDSTKEIWYACIEGPEAAAYERGTAQLVDGEAQVDFSEHFELVANPETMTVILTPNSASSEGLAVIEKTATGIKIKELRNGTGNYKFDWEVKCVRKGYEDFEVIHDKKRMEEMMGIDHTQENK